MNTYFTSYPFRWDDDDVALPLTSLLYTRPIIRAAKEMGAKSQHLKCSLVNRI